MTDGERALALFEAYVRLTGVTSLEHSEAEEPALQGKTLGIVNGSSWIALWSIFFGRKHLPGVKLVSVGNEATQLNFMRAHREGRPCPPRENIDTTCRYARDLLRLYAPDAILLTCSTMNRAFPFVREAVAEYGVPVLQIDEPMMEKAVSVGRRILIVATHGPTVDNTRALLDETAGRLGAAGRIECFGATVEEAFHLLGQGDVRGHNRLIEGAIEAAKAARAIDCVVLAQLSMSVFCVEHPDAQAEYGVPVLCSGDEGFARMRSLLAAR